MNQRDRSTSPTRSAMNKTTARSALLLVMYRDRVYNSAVARSALGAAALLLLCPGVVFTQVTTAQYDNARTGAYATETLLTPRNVNPTSFGKTHVIPVDGDVYAQVLYLPSVTIPSKGTHAVIYVATEHNSVYAFDAGAPGEPLWHVDLSGSGAMPV